MGQVRHLQKGGKWQVLFSISAATIISFSGHANRSVRVWFLGNDGSKGAAIKDCVKEDASINPWPRPAAK